MLQAQSPSCCGAPQPSTAFAQLGQDDAFRSAHAEPLSIQHSGGGAMTTIDVADGAPTRAYRVQASEPSDAYVLVFHEWWGLNEHIKAQADAIAASLDHKATILAVDLYDGKVTSKRAEAAQLMEQADEARIRSIIKAVIASLGPNARIATVGWCFGGGWSHRAALMGSDRTKACVIYYGMPETDITVLQTMAAPVLGIFARQDAWITPAIVETFNASMQKAGRSLTVAMYEADHAFANPSNPHHDKQSAADAYKRVIAFFTEHLLR